MLIVPYVLSLLAALIGLDEFISLSVIPFGYLMLLFTEYFMRNSYRLSLLDRKRAKKALDEENDEALIPKTSVPFDPDNTEGKLSLY